MHNDDALQQDPILFIRTFLKRPDGQPANPHPAQEVFLRNIRKLTVAPWGRQTGKSEGLGQYVPWYAVTKPNRRIYIIAPTLDQARIIFNEVSFHFQTTLKSQLKRKPIDFPFPKIVLKNGTEIHARGANSPQYIRGKNAHLIICDEAAFMKDRTITDVIQPMQTVTGKEPDAALILISTPFGEGAFKQMYESCHQPNEDHQAGFTEENDPWEYGISEKCAYFNYPSSANPHADRDFLEAQKNRYGADSLLWRTEYLAQFADDELAVFPWVHIKWAYENYPGFLSESDTGSLRFPLSPEARHKYVQGSDLANRNDYYVSAIFDHTDTNRIIFAHMSRFHKRGYTAIRHEVREVANRFHAGRTLVDGTSLGESVVEDLENDGVPGVEGYSFTNKSKYEIVQELARLFAEHRLLIPYQTDILNELRYFAYDITPGKVVRMEAKRGHDDIVMAMALAAHLCMLPSEIGWFTGVATFDQPPATYREPHLNLIGTSRQPLDRSAQGYVDPFTTLCQDTDDANEPDESVEELWPD